MLLSASAVREKARQILALAKADQLAHFRLDLSRMTVLAAQVAEVTRQAIPRLMCRFTPAGGIFCMPGGIAGRNSMPQTTGRAPPSGPARPSTS